MSYWAHTGAHKRPLSQREGAITPRVSHGQLTADTATIAPATDQAIAPPTILAKPTEAMATATNRVRSNSTAAGLASSIHDHPKPVHTM